MLNLSEKSKLEVLVFPDPGRVTSFSIDRMLAGVSLKAPIFFNYISANEICAMARVKAPKKQWVFFHWPETLYGFYLSRNLALMVSLLPKPIRKIITKKISDKILNNLSTGLFKNHSVAFYFHDYRSFHRVPAYREIDDYVRPFLYKHSSAVFFAEQSAAEEIYKKFGKRENVIVAPLGDYTPHHGPKIDRVSARMQLGVPQNAKTILAIGTLRGQRQLKAAIAAIQQYPDLFLLAGGLRHVEMRSKNIISVSGYVDHAKLNLMISASDYLLHTGKDYLTSASVRVAMSYGLPVLAEPFGATIDMCRGALVPIDNSNLELAFGGLPDPGSDAYETMVSQAMLRNQERSWDNCSKNIADVFLK